MNERRVEGLLGLCEKAGALKSGEDAVLKAIRSRKAYLILLSGDASENTVKEMRDKAAYYQTELITLPFTKEELGRLIGLSGRSSLAIVEEGLARLVKEAACGSENEVDHID